MMSSHGSAIPSRRVRLGAVGAALLVLVVSAVGWWRSQLPPAPTDGARGIFSRPLAGGSRVSLREAIASFPLPIYRPSVALASDDSLREAWVRLEDPEEVFLIYDSGIVVSCFQLADSAGTQEFAAAQIAQGVPGSITDIGGVSAFEIPPDRTGNGGSIRLEVGDTIVYLYGTGDSSLQDLREIARSVVGSVDRIDAEHAAAA